MRVYKTGKRLAVLLLAGLLLMGLYGCGNPYDRYEKALELFGEGNYADAADAFGKLGDYLQAETYAAYSQGLTYYAQGAYAEAEPYFAQTQDFMYGKERYRVCHAYALEQQEQFSEAANWYDNLGDFEDAKLRAAYCRARAAALNGDYEAAIHEYKDAGTYADAAARLDTLNFEIYEHAAELMEEKNYEQALTLFLLLGDQYGADEQASICKNYFQDQSIEKAEALIKAGDKRGAYDIYASLSGYRDAETRAQELAEELGIATAGVEE